MASSKDHNTSERLVAFFGGTSRAATALRKHKPTMSKQLIEHWRKQKYIPAKWANIVDTATGGNITASQVMQTAVFYLERR